MTSESIGPDRFGSEPFSRKPPPPLIRLWFLADALLALTPQVHHLASDGAPVLGIPRVILYLFATSAFIAASVVAAYLGDRARRAR